MIGQTISHYKISEKPPTPSEQVGASKFVVGRHAMSTSRVGPPAKELVRRAGDPTYRKDIQ
jgi:hypothetical protein